jgi:hypothetical protein
MANSNKSTNSSNKQLSISEEVELLRNQTGNRDINESNYEKYKNIYYAGPIPTEYIKSSQEDEVKSKHGTEYTKSSQDNEDTSNTVSTSTSYKQLSISEEVELLRNQTGDRDINESNYEKYKNIYYAGPIPTEYTKSSQEDEVMSKHGTEYTKSSQ